MLSRLPRPGAGRPAGGISLALTFRRTFSQTAGFSPAFEMSSP